MVVVDVIGEGCNGLKKGNLCCIQTQFGHNLLKICHGNEKFVWCGREMCSYSLINLILKF